MQASRLRIGMVRRGLSSIEYAVIAGLILPLLLAGNEVHETACCLTIKYP